MKILYLINFAGKAGTEKYVLNLVKAFNKNNDKCFFAYNIDGLLSEQMKELGILSLKLEMKNPFDIKAAKTLSDFCKENKIDIIHTQYPRENFIAILSKIFNPKIKVVNTCHLTLKTGFSWKILNMIFTRFDNKIISVCNYGKELMIKNGVCKSKITVIFNGIYYEEKNTKSTIREELGIDNDTFVICTLARYAPEKGLSYLLDSFAALKKLTDRKLALIIAGDGELFDEIKKKKEELLLSDTVFQLGYRQDSENILAGSDMFINSAMCNEALSFAILEALGFGLPVIATNIGGNPDIINKSLPCGELVEYGDAKMTSEAILGLVEDKEKYKLYSDNAIKTVKEKFNLEKLLSDIYEVYREVLN